MPLVWFLSCFPPLSLPPSAIAIANMSSLRRILSLQCTDTLPSPLQQPNPRKIARHSSLPILSLHNSRGLPSSLPSSRFGKARHGTCTHRVSLPPPSCGPKPENAPHRFASFRSVPTWSADEELDSTSGRCTITRSISRKESLDMEDSIVYKELCDSIRHLELPSCRYMHALGSEGVMGSASRDEGEVCDEEMQKNMLEPASHDVRERPLSLRMLKRKVSQKPQVRVSSKSRSTEPSMVIGGSNPHSALFNIGGDARDSLLCDVGGAVNSAFSSLVFMMESLQEHSLWLRKVLMSEADVRLHVMMAKVHQEMQDTLLWLFQKVFSCTPKLMLLTMMLLVDFAVHSMGEHVALAVMPMGEPPTCAAETPVSLSAAFGRLNTFTDGGINVADWPAEIVQAGSVEPRLCEGGAGDAGVRTMKVGGSMDGESLPSTFTDGAAMTVEDDTHGVLNDASSCGYCTVDDNESDRLSEERRMLTSMWQHSVSNRYLMKVMLVAPVQAPALEADDYPCFDRTDLTYQHELSRDPSNPLLLSNYAQFLHLVRHDHPRAEELYKRAVKADPVDGEVMGKYASFLWVAKEDVEGADEAFKAALAVDPSNAYHAGSYAYFLWNSNTGQDDSNAGQDDNIIATATYQQVSTT